MQQIFTMEAEIFFRFRLLSAWPQWHWNCLKRSIVSDILLCTQNPMLIKGLYGILRDEGYHVDLSDFPAHAVQQIMKQSYGAIIIDSQAFGMPAEDAVRVIKTIAPDIRVILAGYSEEETDSLSIKVPIDLEKLRHLVHSLHNTSITSHI